MLEQVWHEILECELTFTDGYHIGAARKILVEVVGRIRSAHDNQAASLLCRADYLEHAGTRHQVAVHTDDGWLHLTQVRLERLQPREGRVKQIRVDATRFQIRTDVQQPQRWIRLHHRQLVRIFVQKVAVGEQYVHQSVAASTEMRFRKPSWRARARRSSSRRRIGRASFAYTTEA